MVTRFSRFLPATLAVIGLCALAGCASARREGEAVAAKDGLRVHLSVDTEALMYTVKVENRGTDKIAVFDDVSANVKYRWEYGPAIIKVLDSDGHVVSQNSIRHDDWWTSAVFCSTSWLLPVEMTDLPPGGTLEGTFSLAGLCWGLPEFSLRENNLRQWMTGRKFKLMVSIFHSDGNLKQRITAETSWLVLDR